MSAPLHVLIVGCGIVGERHARVQKEAGNSLGFFDIVRARAKKSAADFEGVFFDQLQTALEWSSLVHICTPDDLHFEIARQAIQNVTPVLCEKPLVTSLREAKHLQRLVHKYNTPFFVGHNYRFTEVFEVIKGIVQEKKKTPIISLETTYLHNMREYLEKTPWRKEQNFLYGGAMHAIDLAYWLVNEPVMSVQAQTGKKVIEGYPHPEDYHILLKFQSGCIARVWANAAVALPIHKTDVQLSTENETFIADNKSGILYKYNKYQANKEFTEQQFPITQTINKVIECVNGFVTKKKVEYCPLPQIDEAVEVMKIVDAVEQSIKHKKVIRL